MLEVLLGIFYCKVEIFEVEDVVYRKVFRINIFLYIF